MQMSIVKSASRFEAKLLVSSALAEMIEDEKADRIEEEQLNYEYGMMQMIADDYDYFESGRSYYADEEDNDYGQYDNYYDPYEDIYFDWDY